MTRPIVLYLFGVPAVLASAWLLKSNDFAARRSAASHVAAAAETADWQAACEQYDAALAAADEVLPLAEIYDLRLAAEHARARSGGLVEALRRTQAILHDLGDDPEVRPGQEAAARFQLATLRYYAARLMQREGAARPRWLPFAEAARQDFRFLAEQAVRADGSSGVPWERAQANLEATVRFLRSTDEEALAEPLPEEALLSNTGLTQALTPPEAEQEQPPSSGDNRNQMNGNDPALRRERVQNGTTVRGS